MIYYIESQIGSDDTLEFAGVQRDSSDIFDKRHLMLTLPHETSIYGSALLPH